MDNEMIKEEKTIGQLIREEGAIDALYLNDLVNYYENNKTLNKVQEEVAIVKNYKIMCELLKEPEKEGNSKRAQMKEWKRYFDFEREGQKYIIKEIYDIPLPKGHYSNPMDIINEYLICLYIKEEIKNPKNKDKGVTCAKIKLAQFVGYINDKFQEHQKSRNKLLHEIIGEDQVIKLNQEEYYNKLNIVNDVYEDIPNKYKSRLEKAINSLVNKKLILKETAYYGTKIYFEVNPNQTIYEVMQEDTEIDTYGDEINNGHVLKMPEKQKSIPLTDKEKNKYSEIQKKILKTYSKRNELGEKVSCESIKDIYRLGKNNRTGELYIDEYYKRLNKEIHKMGYKTIYEAYKLYFHPKYIEEESWKLWNKLECIENNNRLFLEKLIRNAENKMNREIKKIEELEMEQKEKEIKIKELKEDTDLKISVLEELIYMKTFSIDK